ncbi:hypothetical protein B566_EDAN009822 [Ephemera danica]|nr:hypothetical protein B566_EDAN009822 [Ephemera danica]
MLIRQCEFVGELPGHHAVYKIKAVSFLPLLGPDATAQDLGLEPCIKHQNKKPGERSGAMSAMFDLQKQPAFVKTWGTIKSATNSIKSTTQQAAALASAQVKSGKKRDSKENERFERRILEELHKIVTETDSFYFSLTGDLTNSMQRQWKQQQQQLSSQPSENIKPLWRRVDNRFFWNMNMLHDIMQLETPQADPWLLPVIQGFVQIEQCKVDVGRDHRSEAMEPCYEASINQFSFRFRAGTRYKRRGVDDSGKCANYVETEQIISYHQHQVSFVQVRGSVPVYWSQPGYKYRPPPRLDKDAAETQAAFEKHFHEELSVYGPVCIVSLVDQAGKEKTIHDAYTNHIHTFNCPDLTYATFDFHEYCRGMHFENVSILVSALLDVIQELRFCWLDREGLICMQNGVFRVNCIDCLDRTNVVQTALAKTVMEIVFTKLGLIAPEGVLPANIRSTFQLLWANNGDTISRQYAGTNALKGDYTRTGERKFTGMMKDGMNSANRYYLSRFKDLYRQATIDLMLGNAVSVEVLSGVERGGAADAEDLAATAEHVKLLMEDCKKLLVSENDVVLGAWGLIDADPVTGDPSETDMDAILILTPTSYYVACYDEQTDRVTSCQHVLLEDLTSIELGADQTGSSGSLFKAAKLGSGCCIRLNYKLLGEPGYFHMFRSTNLRFFNNMAIVIRNEEEIVESMKAVCEAFSVALEMQQLPVPVQQGGRLDKRKSKLLPNAEGGPCRSFLDMSSLPQMTRNVSENQLLALKSVGTKAISNVTQQFTKLNKLTLRNSFNSKKTDSTQLPTKGAKVLSFPSAFMYL